MTELPFEHGVDELRCRGRWAVSEDREALPI